MMEEKWPKPFLFENSASSKSKFEFKFGFGMRTRQAGGGGGGGASTQINRNGGRVAMASSPSEGKAGSPEQGRRFKIPLGRKGSIVPKAMQERIEVLKGRIEVRIA